MGLGRFPGSPPFSNPVCWLWDLEGFRVLLHLQIQQISGERNVEHVLYFLHVKNIIICGNYESCEPVNRLKSFFLLKIY